MPQQIDLSTTHGQLLLNRVSLALSQRRFLIQVDGFGVSLNETNAVVGWV